ncbi:FprA family A-type flavoprotein [Mitsuokella sp. AF33-22]|uniref:FprA family A-type flavoprotein n=1 Tax=Mitsuokella sp. AF33-22 TaxID=2292047 RepID=UPI000E51AEA8|nr:FprA family A-type flavoprotein [Mitsuokella sp. AF33-22]RHM55553.1 FprA family A-type flavoprotein [Mitsuokella sp. AF33-22]
MQAVEIRKDIYWVGAIDWSMRSFHGYETSRGSSYNAYLILDEKITLIDTVKEPFKEELLERIASVIDPAKIDYIVSSHVEPDHSGAIPFMMQHCPNAKIITSLPNGLKGLKAHYGELPYIGVKAGDTLSIGQRTLQFIPTPMLHWPDSMVTYCPEETILFSNDAFGQHLASGCRYDDDNDLPTLFFEAKKYYANILMLYGRQAQAALKALHDLDISMIATGHGLIWRSHVKEILRLYQEWSTGKLEDRAVVVFDTMWHSTEMMARAITEAFQQKGIPAIFYDVKENALSDILTEILTSKYLAVGSPTINNQMMPTIASFLCYLKGLAPKGRKAFAFGSYGWGGQSIGLVEEELKAAGCEIVLEKQRQANVPSAEDLQKLTAAVQAICK